MKRLIARGIVIFIAILILCTGCGKTENEEVDYAEIELSSISLLEEETELSEEHEKIEEVMGSQSSESDAAEEAEKEEPGTLFPIGPSETGSQKTDNAYYVIYPSVIEEDYPRNASEEYAVWKKTINITFPQIYYWNEHDNFGSEIESGINQELFLLSINNDDSFLFGRNIGGLQQCTTDYVITKADSDIFSIVFTEQLITTGHTQDGCRGIAINVATGEALDLSEYVTLGTDLVSQVESGTIEFISEEYEWSNVSADVVQFEKDYQAGSVDTAHCYYLEENALNLIVPLNRETGGYIVLRLPIFDS